MKSDAIIEIPEGSKDKIEIKDGVAFIDRVLSIEVPVNYGFVPNTLASDGDALDIFVLSKNPLKTLDNVSVNLIGIFECTDQGVRDDKLFASLDGEKFDDLTIFKNLTYIGNYLMNYKPGFVVSRYRELDSSGDDRYLVDAYRI